MVYRDLSETVQAIKERSQHIIPTSGKWESESPWTPVGEHTNVGYGVLPGRASSRCGFELYTSRVRLCYPFSRSPHRRFAHQPHVQFAAGVSHRDELPCILSYSFGI